MRTTESMRPPDSRALRKMERDLRRMLRAHRLSESFVDRHAEDALQRGVVEYLRVVEAGTEIREPVGFVLQAAFRRAIDELRREARAVAGVEVEKLLEEAGDTSPSAEEIAVDDITAADLHSAIDSLPAEERQALCLHYFEELSDARSAKLLFCSERTFRRRLRKGLADLAELLGAPAPEAGSHRGLEIGLAAWASLGAGRVVVSSSPLEFLAGAFESLHSLPGKALGRLRGAGADLAASDTPERIGAVAAGPAGKVIGGCAGAAMICALSGVVGPGVQLGGSQTGEGEHHAGNQVVVHRGPYSGKPLVVAPKIRPEEKVEPTHAITTPSTRTTGPAPRHRQHSDGRQARSSHHHQSAAVEEPPDEEAQVEEQFSGVAQAAAESEAKSEAPASTDQGDSVAKAAPAPSTAEHTQASSEERQVEEQIRGPLAR